MRFRCFVRAALFALVAVWTAPAQSYTITTFAGGGLPVNTTGTSANLYGPTAVATDKSGNVFFVDQNDVLRWDAATSEVTLAAGNGAPGFSGDNGPAAAAQLDNPRSIAVDSTGNLYIADTNNERVRKVSNGVITTIAGNGTAAYGGDGGPAAGAQLNNPLGVAVDAAGNLFIADAFNGRIREISGGVITTVAGGGNLVGPYGNNTPATGSYVGLTPFAIAVDSADNLYIVDQPTGYASLYKVSNGVLNPVDVAWPHRVLNGSVQADAVGGLATDTAGNLYYAFNFVILEISNGATTVVAGNGMQGFAGDNGSATAAELNPTGIAVDATGNLYLADYGSNRVRKVSNGLIGTIVGGGSSVNDNGPATSGQLNLPGSVAVDQAGDVYISDASNNRVRKVSNGEITTVAGNGPPGYSGDNGPALAAQLNLVGGGGITVDSAGNLYIADTGNNRIRKVSGGTITTIAGNGPSNPPGTPCTSAQPCGGFGGDNGPAVSAQLYTPRGVAVDSAGNIYIADANNARIRKVSNGVVTTVAGGGSSLGNGPATSALLNFPSRVAVDSSGSLYIADQNNSIIRKVSNGIITTIAGNQTVGFSGDNGPATSAQLNYPADVTVDSAGDIFIADFYNARIREVSNGVITTVAGNGTQAFGGDNGPAPSAELNHPSGITVDSTGRLFIADTVNNRIRVATPRATPAINPGGVVPNDSPVPVIQAGSWITIWGTNLAPEAFLWNADFPTSLGGVSINIDNKPAYLWFVSPDQINLQVPDDTTTGTVSVAVATPSGTATSTVTLAPYAPSFSLLGDGKHVAGEIATPNGTGAYGNGTYDLVGPSNTFSFNTRPVKAGETLTLYGVGFGPTTPHVAAGQIFSGSAPTVNPVTISIGGVNANVIYSGITEAGLYQFNLVVSPNTPAGDQSLQATVDGVQTPSGPVVTIQ